MSIDHLTTPETTGISHLPPTSQLRNINEFIFAAVRPHLKGRILEMESGFDNISALIIENEIPVHLSNTDSQIRNTLHERFDNNSIVRSIHNIDFHHPEFEQVYAKMTGAFEVVFHLDIFHRPVDAVSIRNANLLLKKQGSLIILLPVNYSTFNDMSIDMRDLKKYNQKYIADLLGSNYENMRISIINLPKITHGTAYSQFGLSAIVVAGKK